MKHMLIIGGLSAICLHMSAEVSKFGNIASMATNDYRIVVRGPHERTWERIDYRLSPAGQQIPVVRRYEELSTGMHYQDERGVWQESKEEIEILPNGRGAVARQGQHQAMFPVNINNGRIALRTPAPNPVWIRSRVLGLSYLDTATGESVLIAELKDSDGIVVGDNAVLYPDAFTDVSADLRYTYTLAGFEQDVILREKLPPPEEFGLDPQSTRIEVFTEFFEPPAHSLNRQTRGNSEDDEVRFGVMKIGRGKAFAVADANGREKGKDVVKKWTNLEGRNFLIEQLPFSAAESELNKLPGQPKEKRKPNRPKQSAGKRTLPAVRSPESLAGNGQLARADFAAASRPGYVLDYIILNGNTNAYVFKADTTYYISNTVAISGPVTFEGGSVIKFATNASATINADGAILCAGGPYRPTIFTSRNDNSVGEVVSGSTGTPATMISGTYLSAPGGIDAVFAYLRFSYAGTALLGGDQITVKHCQFIKCYKGIVEPADFALTLGNVLFSECNYPVFYDYEWYLGAAVTLVADNITSDKGSAFFSLSSTADYFYITIRNCLFTRYPYSVIGDLENYCTDGELVKEASFEMLATNTWFQSVGGGAYYLASNSTNRNTGTTGIDGALLADLRKRTTYPPVVFSNQTFNVPTNFSPLGIQDTDAPDLGYHYDPIDYAFGGCTANTNMTFSAGTSVGWFRTSSGWAWGGNHTGHAIHLGDRQILTFDGNASAPNYFARCNTVQEGRFNSYDGGVGPGGITSWADNFPCDPTVSPLVQARFTRCSVLAGEVGSFFADDWGYLAVQARDCEFWGGGMIGFVMTYSYTNCLFHRVQTGQVEGWPGNSANYRNSTWKGGKLHLRRLNTWLAPNPDLPALVTDCAFDGTEFDISSYYWDEYYEDYLEDESYSLFQFDYNAYSNSVNPLELGGAHDKSSVTFVWKNGPLGNFYLPTNSVLINAGSVAASTDIGLYCFTTQTNQTLEAGTTVDIGYHYPALDLLGVPVDEDRDTIPKWMDVNDRDPNIGLLILTIDLPQNGSALN